MFPNSRASATILFLVLVAAAGTCSSAHASPSCPSSVLTWWYAFHGGDTFIPAAAFDTTIVNADGDTTRVSLDRAQAQMNLNAVGRVWAGERVLERFDVAGVPIGTVVSATIILSLQGEVYNNCGGGGCGAYFTATVAGGADSVVTDESIPGPCDACTRQVNTTLTLPVTITAGTPIDVALALLYHATNVAWGRATISGVYGVSGLPPGARAIGCSSGDVTPVRPRSWGRLKAAYR